MFPCVGTGVTKKLFRGTEDFDSRIPDVALITVATEDLRQLCHREWKLLPYDDVTFITTQ